MPTTSREEAAMTSPISRKAAQYRELCRSGKVARIQGDCAATALASPGASREAQAPGTAAPGTGTMLTAFRLALEDTFAPQQRRTLGLSLALAALLLAVLWLGCGLVLAHSRVAGIWWLDALIDVLGGVAALLLAWLLFPAMTMLILGFFLDGIVDTVESRRYPGSGAGAAPHRRRRARRSAAPRRAGAAAQPDRPATLSGAPNKPLYLLPIERISCRA